MKQIVAGAQWGDEESPMIEVNNDITTTNFFEQIANDNNVIYLSMADPLTFNSYVYFKDKDILLFKVKLEALVDLKARIGEEAVEVFIRESLKK